MANKKIITEASIEALTRNFFKEAEEYGFRYEHYIKFVNNLLEFAIEGKANGRNKLQKTEDSDDIAKSLKLPIISKRLIIREFDADKELNILKNWLKDKYGKYFMLSYTSSKPFNLDNLLNDENNIMGLVTLPDKEPIGIVAYLHIDKTHKKAELRKLIGDPVLRGKGYGLEATKCWINYGKNGLKLKKIYLNTVETNIRNIKLNEELGFKVEGILRNELQIKKKSNDVLRMGLLFD